MSLEDHKLYLGADQSTVLGVNYMVYSCTTVALHISLRMCYSDDKLADDCKLLRDWIEFGSSEWWSRRTEHHGRYEHPSKVYERSTMPKKLGVRLTDKDIIGMNVVRQVAQNPPDYLVYGVKKALDNLVTELLTNQRCHSLACVFVSEDFSIAVTIKTDENRNLYRIDVIDSHRRIVPSIPLTPEHHSGSAVWGRFHNSTEAAAKFILEIFPPKESDMDIGRNVYKQDVKADNRVAGETEAEFFARSEREKIPRGMFEFHVYRPRHASIDKAQRAMEL
jgi:hypothetical protein